MNTKPGIFDDMDTDPLAEVLSAPARPVDPERGANHLAAHLPAAPAAFKDKCPKCRGSGRFHSFSGRLVGQCFHCKGAGTIEYKTSPEQRRASRTRVADKKATEAESNWTAFAADNEAAAAWIVSRTNNFPFASEMNVAVRKFGRLTDGQMAAVAKCIAGDAARQAERAEKKAAVTGDMDVKKLDACFQVAREAGAKRAAIRTPNIIFSLAPAGGNNPGAIYCKTRNGGTYLGKIMGGQFKGAFACTPALKAEVAEAAQDPKAAALRFAAETGECSVCGITLTDPVSVAAGIGPICAGKFRW